MVISLKFGRYAVIHKGRYPAHHGGAGVRTAPDPPGRADHGRPRVHPDSLPGPAEVGAQVISFTTGRGNPTGFPLAPVVKVISTRQGYHRREDDMDVDAGTGLEGHKLEFVYILDKTYSIFEIP